MTVAAPIVTDTIGGDSDGWGVNRGDQFNFITGAQIRRGMRPLKVYRFELRIPSHRRTYFSTKLKGGV